MSSRGGNAIPPKPDTKFDAQQEAKKWLGPVFKNELELVEALQHLNRPPEDKEELIHTILALRNRGLVEGLREGEEKGKITPY